MNDLIQSVGYIRVSSAKQTKTGNSESAQEQIILNWATKNKREIVKIFVDKGKSGKNFDRDDFKEMVVFLVQNPHIKEVIVEDLDRWSRAELFEFLQIKETLKKINVSIVYINQPFINEAAGTTGQMIEAILAISSNARSIEITKTTNNKTKERLKAGFWTFKLPPWYKYQEAEYPNKGAIVVPNRPMFNIAKIGLSNLAGGQLTVATFTEYLKNHGYDIPYRKVLKHCQNQLNTPYYTYPDWGLNQPIKAQHEPMITEREYLQIVKRIKNNYKQPYRTNVAREFPLRGWLVCEECGNKLTSWFSKGRNASYPYYGCKNRHCKDKNLCFKADTVEDEFLKQVLGQIQFSEIDLACMKLFGEQVFKEQAKTKIDSKKALKTQISHMQSKIDKLMDSLINSTNQLVFQKLEFQIAQLDKEKSMLQVTLDAVESKGQTESSLYHTALQEVLQFSKNMIKTYKEGSSEIKMFIIRTVLNKPVVYTKKTVYQTVSFSQFYAVFGELKSMENSWCPKGLNFTPVRGNIDFDIVVIELAKEIQTLENLYL